jgi:hypothetical protein
MVRRRCAILPLQERRGGQPGKKGFTQMQADGR